MQTAQMTDIASAEVTKATHEAKSLRGYNKATEAQITEKAQEFESVFLGQMLQHMFDGIDADPMFGGGHGEEVYKSFMVNEYAKMITKTGGIGVADHVKGELMRLQEVGMPMGEAAAAPMVN